MAGKDEDFDSIPDAARSGLSRRQILTAGLVAAGSGLARAEAAPSAHGLVGIAATGSTAVEFRARLDQTGATGELFRAYGYLTKVQDLADDELFAGTSQNETTALLTAFADGALTRRIHDSSVHSLDIVGTLTIFHRVGPGASFADPTSFQVGTPVAQFALTLQDVLTVFAPGKGLPTLNGDMQQTQAHDLDGSPGKPKFGRVGSTSRLLATGLGMLIDPVTTNSSLEMAGNWATTAK